jgi:hypothetical protein
MQGGVATRDNNFNGLINKYIILLFILNRALLIVKTRDGLGKTRVASGPGGENLDCVLYR